MIPDKGEQPVVGDVKRGELRGIPFLFWMFLGALLALILASFLFRLALCGSFAAWAVIIIVCEAAQILSSRVEYLSSRRYSSSMVAGGSRERDWKKGVVGPKLLQKFCKTVSML